MKITKIIKKKDHLEGIVQEYLGFGRWLTKRVMIDPKTKKIMKTSEGQPISYVKKEHLRIGPFCFATVQCLGISDHYHYLPPKEALMELYTKTIIREKPRNPKEKPPKKEDSIWELMRH